MSVLASLARAYERLPNAPPFGYSLEKIGFLISLNEDGSVSGAPIDLREGTGKKRTARLMAAPQPAKRTAGIAPNFLWDKTSYVLGITAGAGKRTEKEHAAFVARHRDLLPETGDHGLRALAKFLENWRPEHFEIFGWPEEMKDQNIIFGLESERLQNLYLHDRPAARALWARIGADDDKPQTVCLVTGEHAPIARLHPAIKGVWGAQSSGASIVSFNLDAFESYDHKQGDNAPVSEFAAFAYTTALNQFLQRESGHRLQIGDASTVFWADASAADASAQAESQFLAMTDSDFGEISVDEKVEAKKIDAILQAVAQGQPVDGFRPDFPEGVRFYVLALAPNAARLSIRFFIEDDFQAIAKRYLEHIARMRIEPPPKDPAPKIWRLLVETAAQRKSENILPQLAGDTFRAILQDKKYPFTLLSTLLMRLRADGDVNALRAAILKAVLIRNFGWEAPVSLDSENADPGYLLGRLFATYEYLQTQALGGNVNATIRDQYYGSASATPRAVFPLLQRKASHHLAKLRKDKPGFAVRLDKEIGAIFEKTDADSAFPSTLNMRRQALFAVGYYHQKNEFYKARKGQASDAAQEDLQ